MYTASARLRYPDGSYGPPTLCHFSIKRGVLYQVGSFELVAEHACPAIVVFYNDDGEEMFTWRPTYQETSVTHLRVGDTLRVSRIAAQFLLGSDKSA